MEPFLRDITKVAIVVKDIRETIKTYADQYGVGPWKIWKLDSDNVQDMVVRNNKQNYSMLIGRSKIGNTEWELIEPLDDISIFAEFLRKNGEGLHHLTYKVDNFKETVEIFKTKGTSTVQSGNWCGKYNFAYFDVMDDLKHVVEICDINEDFKYPEPIETYDTGKSSETMFNSVFQVGIVVKDIKATAEKYSDEYGLGPWSFSKFNPGTVKDMNIDEKNTDHDFTVATGMVGSVELEFMEAHDEKSIYAQHYKKYGEGLHHVCVIIDNYEKVMKSLREKGQKILQGGDWFGCIYVYTSSEKDLKFILELYDAIPGFTRPAPYYVYPC